MALFQDFVGAQGPLDLEYAPAAEKDSPSPGVLDRSPIN